MLHFLLYPKSNEEAGTTDNTGHTMAEHSDMNACTTSALLHPGISPSYPSYHTNPASMLSEALIHAIKVNISSSDLASRNLILNMSSISPSQPIWFSTSQFMTQAKTHSELVEVSSSTVSCCLGRLDRNDLSSPDILLHSDVKCAVHFPEVRRTFWEKGKGKGIIVDDAAAPSGGVSIKRPSSGPAPSFRDVSGDSIHTNFFSFSAGLYNATYPEDGVVGNCEFTQVEWDATYRPTFGVLTKDVFKDLAVCKTIVDQFPTPGEMVRVKDSRLKGYEEKVASLTVLELQVCTLKNQVFGLNDKLATSDASFSKSNAKGKRRKKIKSLSKSLDNLYSEERLAEASSLVAQTDYAFLNKIFEYATKPLLVILQLEPEKLVHPAIVPIPKDTRVSPPITKESTVTLVSKSLELSVNVVPASFVIALEQVSAAIDGLNLEMTDGATHSMSRGVFMRGISHVLNDVAEVTVVGSERVSSGLSDVVVALSAGEKGDGSAPSSIVEEVVVPPSRV
nr:hypothetical protein [Tanacetum cinerariifolium]